MAATGPTTSEGKSVSRCNALKHGLTAKTLIGTLAGEATLQATVKELSAEFQPVGFLERELVTQIAESLLTTRLAGAVARATARYVMDVLTANPSASDDENLFALGAHARFDLVQRYHTTAGRNFLRYMRALKELQAHRTGGPEVQASGQCRSLGLAVDNNMEGVTGHHFDQRVRELIEKLSDPQQCLTTLHDIVAEDASQDAVTEIIESFFRRFPLAPHQIAPIAAALMADDRVPLNRLCKMSGIRQRHTVFAAVRTIRHAQSTNDRLVKALERYVTQPQP